MSSTSGYKFDISNGQVTGESRVFGDHTVTLQIPTTATFSVGSGTITETLSGERATKTLQFTADSSDPRLYHLNSENIVIAHPTTTQADGDTFGYQFTITNGAVTAMQVSRTDGDHTFTRTVHTSPTTSFSVNADGSVTQTSVQGHSIESITYVPSGTSGLYAVSSETETFILPNGSATHLDVQAWDRAKFTIDSSGAVTAVDRVLPNGSDKTITPGSATTYSQLAAGYVLEVHTHGTHSSYEVYHDGNGDGIYTEVAHGSGATVDLVGLQAQITTAINGVL